MNQEKLFISLQVSLDQNRHVSVRYFIISGSRNKINNVALFQFDRIIENSTATNIPGFFNDRFLRLFFSVYRNINSPAKIFFCSVTVRLPRIILPGVLIQ